MTCLGFKGHSEAVNKQGACKGKGVSKKPSIHAYVLNGWPPGLLALFLVQLIKNRFQGRLYKNGGIRTSQGPSMSALAILCSESFN